jgi:hypothetical protein
LPDGRKLLTLRGAAECITALRSWSTMLLTEHLSTTTITAVSTPTDYQP